ncbi:alanyl-tRNA synthetase [Caminicella sporogenes DSM 14501]|uniref:Alanine--tRNA ligase n=1 Tax=Caminicella sporogenes DSM 14501 TaxID=1121266 RepID=A0A1M6LQY8_9FIRM|nr:alanine--tRNA ligase [Caminicella sporogenes]RKD27919.1 alanine--tRNA ligase [Caminicella sporogenes]SHJ73605.1 alanyl-tRNA synthetase [Caminicella sporogenes DSM 14501]
MEKMSLNEIRKKFLDFFKSKGHYVKSSYSLVPQNDKSLLLINAGMAPLKPYFMGIETPPSTRMATCQKCIRTGDIENVGKTARHATFFEMLGNFSFGDYFKEESITWGWEFCTEHLKMPVEKLWVSIYEEDDEAFEIWNKKIGVPEEKIVRLGKEDNFWEIGTGPCGPCSEIYFDRGEEYGCGSEDCKPGCDCDRYVEFWNHVFTQFDKDENGICHPLPKPNIDTGMGLERVACIIQNVDSIFEIDTIKHILNGVVKIANKKYGISEKDDISIRIITDHIRAVTFMVGDGILPSNEGRGYVLRRLLRRAARHGKLLGIESSFLNELVDRVIEVSGEAYPELIERRDYIKKVIAIEEERFQQTIDQGMEILREFIQKLKENNEETLSGENAFKLYDTYGFPLDLTKEILEEENMKVDEKAFNEEMEKQRERARSAREELNEAGWESDELFDLSEGINSKFVGYDEYETESKILAIIRDKEIVDDAEKGDEITIILDKTPFYPEGGGQVGDRGKIYGKNFKIEIYDCKKGKNNIVFHIGKVVEGKVCINENVKASIDVERRIDTARNHTATHLLHKALKEVLGGHVEQAGSLVTPDRLRFDFTHFQGITNEEIEEIEKIVNKKIFESIKVDIIETSLDNAKKMGATALFGEKYGQVVRVVSIGEFSRELCGGTHVRNSSEISLFKIISESGVAAGVRRIEAITGRAVYKYMSEMNKKIKNIAVALKTNVNDIENKIEVLNMELKNLQKENDMLKNKLASSSLDEIINSAENIEGINVVAYKLENLDMNSVRNLGDKLRDKLGNSFIVLGSEKDGKVNFIAMASDEAVKKGIHSGKIIKEVASIAGGGGGGRPNMAQAGAKDPSKIDKALSKVKELVLNSIK